MRPTFVTSERIQFVVSLVAQHDGEITRRQIGEALHLSEGPTSQIVTAAIQDGLIATTTFGPHKQATLFIPGRARPTRDFFKGWAGAPRLGLDNWSK